MNQSPIFRKTPNKMLLYFFPLFKLMFHQNYRLPLVSESNFCKLILFVRWENCPFLVPDQESRQSESSEKCFLHWCRSIFKRLLLSLYKFDFLRQAPNQKQNITTWVFNGKSLAFILCIRNPIVSKLRRKFFFCFNSIFEHLLPQNYRLHLFIQRRNRKFSILRCLFDGRNFLSGSLIKCLDSLKFAKGAFHIVSVPVSNVYFPATTSSIPFIKMSIRK